MRFGQLGIQLHGAPGGLEGAIGHFQRRRQPHVRRADPGRQRPRGGISAEDAFTGKLQGALHVAGFVSLPHGLEQVGGEERLGFRLAGGLRERRSIFDAGLYQTHRPEAMLRIAPCKMLPSEDRSRQNSCYRNQCQQGGHWRGTEGATGVSGTDAGAVWAGDAAREKPALG
jgi:hypothetical protein